MSESRNQGVKKVVAAGVAVAAVGLAVWVVLNQFVFTSHTTGVNNQQWFYDVGTGERFLSDATVMTPIVPPSGAELEPGVPGGVRAHVYGCGNCDQLDQQFIGYLSWMPLEHASAPPGQWSRFQRVAKVPDDPATPLEGVLISSSAGKQLISSVSERCGGQAYVECPPK